MGSRSSLSGTSAASRLRDRFTELVGKVRLTRYQLLQMAARTRISWVHPHRRNERAPRLAKATLPLKRQAQVLVRIGPSRLDLDGLPTEWLRLKVHAKLVERVPEVVPDEVPRALTAGV
jgi:hypothetical protein